MGNTMKGYNILGKFMDMAKITYWGNTNLRNEEAITCKSLKLTVYLGQGLNWPATKPSSKSPGASSELFSGQVKKSS